MKTRICLRYFVSDYSFHAFYSNIRNMNAVLTNRIADILLFNNKEIYTYVASIRFIGLSWLYICFTACVHFVSPYWLLLPEQKNKCNAEVQISDYMLLNIFVTRNFVSASKKIKKRISKVATVLKSVKLNRVKPRKVKYKAYQFLKNQLYLLLSAKFIAAAAAAAVRSCSME